MRPLLTALILLVLSGKALPDAPKTHDVQLNGHTFALPVGFEIELVAGPPLVERPIEADFDEQGRLYVSDSSGSGEPVEQQLKKKPHRVVRLEDSKGAGKFDRRTIFADKMMFPEGVMWYAGSLYVAAPPSIWKLTDTKGEGVADQRVEWFKGKTLTRCANDLHGPYLGPDGWIYWCKGAFAKQTYDRPGKPPFVTSAAHIFRCRPDGTGIEPVMTGGMDNPVGLAFTSTGERIFSTTFLQHPGGGRRDGLIHAIYGGIYGKDHDPIYQHPWTGPDLMPVLTHMGAAAPCGLTRYESCVFGPEYQDNLFACQFNMHKVSRHILEPSGATFKSRDEDFLVSSNLDFHPTDVLEDADGSLLVVDTGGWYKLCCPTSQLVKPDILGAIYRVRRQGAQRVDDPRGLKLAWERMTPKELTVFLADSRPVVRQRAIQALAHKGAEALPALRGVLEAEATSVEAKRNALWAATQINGPDARALVRAGLKAQDRSIRQVALHSVSLWRDEKARPELLLELELERVKAPIGSGYTQNGRQAAEALGRLGDAQAVPALLAALETETPVERVMEHALLYALIEIGDRKSTEGGLNNANPAIRRAALVALDQMQGGGLTAEMVTKELSSAADEKLREAAWWIAGRHPEWGEAVAKFLAERLQNLDPSLPDQEELVRRLARFASTTAVRELLGRQLTDAGPPEASLVALRAMARAGLKEAPANWLRAVMLQMVSSDPRLVREAVITARALRQPKQGVDEFNAALLVIGTREGVANDIRLNALAALPAGLASVDSRLFDFLRTMLVPEQVVSVRVMTADVLARAKLTAEQLGELTGSLASAGPTELDRLLDAFAQATDDKVGHQLLTALKSPKVRSSLRIETLKPRLAKFGPAIQKQAEELYASINADSAKQRAKLEELLSSLKDGDIRRGQIVFHSTKAACFACHAIGYRGGDIGPDLTRIGQIRSERDLLESIVFPSASLVRSYEPVVVTTKAGKLLNGLVRKDTPDELVLVTGADQFVRLARADIDDIQPSKVSIMPAGLDQQLTPRELADLVAFLRACK
jgi:putative membrane-bound dehydrogenase-like protein